MPPPPPLVFGAPKKPGLDRVKWLQPDSEKCSPKSLHDEFLLHFDRFTAFSNVLQFIDDDRQCHPINKLEI